MQNKIDAIDKIYICCKPTTSAIIKETMCKCANALVDCTGRMKEIIKKICEEIIIYYKKRSSNRM
jgi:hypothetical protein